MMTINAELIELINSSRTPQKTVKKINFPKCRLEINAKNTVYIFDDVASISINNYGTICIRNSRKRMIGKFIEWGNSKTLDSLKITDQGAFLELL